MNKLSEIKVSYSTSRNLKIKINNSKEVYEHMLQSWDMDTIEFREEVKVLYLNRANETLGIFELSKGGVSGSVVDIKIMLSIALKVHASGLILVHNHPSGNLKPSESDLEITKKAIQACKQLDLALLDHLIITRYGYYSMADENHL